MAFTLASIQKGQIIEPPRVLVHGAEGIGKALRNDMPVLMADGSWRPISSLCVGELVATPDGGEAPVLGIFPQGERDTFEVVTDDGGSVVCDGEHLWLTETTNERVNMVRRNVDCFYGAGRIRTTLQIKEAIDSYTGREGRQNLYLPVTKAVAGHDSELPLDPYILGALLGDGGLGGGSVIFTNTDQDIIDRFTTVGFQLNCIDGTPSYRVLGAMERIRDLGLAGCLSNGKYIPEKYLKANTETRLSLLQGLCDTDGHVCEAVCGTIEYVTVSPRLRDDIIALVRSLGGVVTVTEKVPTYTHRGEKRFGQTAYRMFLRLPDDIVPVYCARKVARWTPRTKYDVRRRIVSINPSGRAECTCIYIGHPGHLFVTKDYLVTHNTTFASEAPSPVFLFTEKGRGVLNIAAFPLARTWDDVKSGIRALLSENHEHQALVIDTVDWLEKIIFEALCEEEGKSSIEDFGYGKGYIKALVYWRSFLDMLDQLHDEKGMIIIMLAHSMVKTFQNPDGDNYDQYRLALHDKTAAMLKEWCDAVLFANYDVKIRKIEGSIQKDKGKAMKVHGEIPRLLFTEERPAYWAKNRYALPHTIPMVKGQTWAAFEAAMEAGIAAQTATVEKFSKKEKAATA